MPPGRHLPPGPARVESMRSRGGPRRGVRRRTTAFCTTVSFLVLLASADGQARQQLAGFLEALHHQQVGKRRARQLASPFEACLAPRGAGVETLESLVLRFR